jgi:hypothetical protein
MSLAIVETTMTIKVLYIMNNNNNNKLASTVGQKWTKLQRDIWTIAFIPQ